MNAPANVLASPDPPFEAVLTHRWDTFIKETSLGAPFQRGLNDCCSWVGRWAQAVQGGVPLRQHYFSTALTDDEALALLESCPTGLAGLVSASLEPQLWQRHTKPDPDTIPPFSIALLSSFGGLGPHTLGIVRDHFVLCLIEGKRTTRLRTMPLDQVLTYWAPQPRCNASNTT